MPACMPLLVPRLPSPAHWHADLTATHHSNRLPPLQMEGVRGIFGASQIEGSNSPVSEEGQRMHQHQHQFNNAAGHMRKDETVFADGVVHTVGQVIALVVADTEAQVGCPAWDLLAAQKSFAIPGSATRLRNGLGQNVTGPARACPQGAGR